MNLILQGSTICFWFYFSIREQVFISKDNKYVVIFKVENNLYYNIKIQIYKML